MTAGFERVGTDPTVGRVAVEERLRCAVCEHVADEHDAISRRYCQATQAQALTRRCICPNSE